MRLGVYIGSFDPVHKGHMEVVNYLIKNNYIDKALIVPTKEYWDKKNLTNIDDRINMLKTYENDLIKIDDKHNEYKYTCDLMNALSREIDDGLYLIIGADNLVHFEDWKNHNELTKHKIIVMNRDNIDIQSNLNRLNKENVNISNFIVAKDFKNMDISSTFIRERIKDKDYEALKNLVDDKVIQYIKDHKLYLKKEYNIGMYGGKFMPFHKGHNYCIGFASDECQKLYVIMFYGGSDEERILKNNNEEYLKVENRIEKIKNAVKNYSNVEFVTIDVNNLRKEDGSEDWDRETPLVRNVVGDKLDAVYSSEISYDDYFKRAYPEAVHRVVDYKRIHYPISGTDIRNMKLVKEREKWII